MHVPNILPRNSNAATGGLAPETQAALFHRAIADAMPPETFDSEIARQSARRSA